MSNQERVPQPQVYGCTRHLTGEMVKATDGLALAWAYDTALKEVTQAADNTGDMLDPNAVAITVVVEVMSL